MNCCDINWWSVFWQAAGAIATFSAVVVALWQTKYANRKKVKVSFVDPINIFPSMPIGSIGYMPETTYVGVDVTNVGNRKIIMKNCYLELSKKHIAVITPEATPLGTLSWPIELDIEEKVFIPWREDKFLVFIGKEEAINLNKKLTLYVTDTTGSAYKCTSSHPAKYYLNKVKKVGEHK